MEPNRVDDRLLDLLDNTAYDEMLGDLPRMLALEAADTIRSTRARADDQIRRKREAQQLVAMWRERAMRAEAELAEARKQRKQQAKKRRHIQAAKRKADANSAYLAAQRDARRHWSDANCEICRGTCGGCECKECHPG